MTARMYFREDSPRDKFISDEEYAKRFNDALPDAYNIKSDNNKSLSYQGYLERKISEYVPDKVKEARNKIVGDIPSKPDGDMLHFYCDDKLKATMHVIDRDKAPLHLLSFLEVKVETLIEISECLNAEWGSVELYEEYIIRPFKSAAAKVLYSEEVKRIYYDSGKKKERLCASIYIWE